MKIVFVHHGSILGGAPKSLRFQLEALRKARPDWQLKVLCVYERMRAFFEEVDGVETGKFPEPGLALGKFLIGLSSFWNARNRSELFKDLRNLPSIISSQVECLQAEKPDLVHLNSAILFTTAFAARRRLQLPVVWHIRELLLGARWSPRRLLAKYLLQGYSDYLVTIGPSQGKPFSKRNKVHLIPNIAGLGFAAPSSLRTETRQKLGLKEKDFVVLSLGGLVWRKGPLELLLSRRYLKNRLKFLLVGSDLPEILNVYSPNIVEESLAHLELSLLRTGLVDRLRYRYRQRTFHEVCKQIDKDVQVLPLTAEVQPLLAAADVVVSLHNFPHSSRSVFEAWAARKPIAVFADSGASDGVEHGFNGFVIARKDPRNVAVALDALHDDEDLRYRISKNGFTTAEREHNEESVVEKLLALYSEIQLRTHR